MKDAPDATGDGAPCDYYCCNPFHEHDTLGWPELSGRWATSARGDDDDVNEERGCGTCRHWQPPTDADGFRSPVGFKYDPEFKLSVEREPGWEYLDDDQYHDVLVSRSFGVCQKIELFHDVRRDVDPLPLATVTDGSDYIARSGHLWLRPTRAG